MKTQNELLAQKVVDAFKQNISSEARAHISETEFNELAEIVLEALQIEMSEAVEMVAELERRLKARAGRPDMGI